MQILLCWSLSQAFTCNNLFLYRETPTYIDSISSSFSHNEDYLLDIKLLKDAINQLLVPSGIYNTKIDRINDYIFLCFFFRNDFLPHTPSINIRNDGITILINAYKKTIGELYENSKEAVPPTLVTQDGRPVWITLKNLLKQLKIQEHNRLKDEHISRSRHNCKHTTQSIERFNVIPMIDRRTEEYINPCEYMWQSRYYKKLFNMSE